MTYTYFVVNKYYYFYLGIPTKISSLLGSLEIIFKIQSLDNKFALLIQKIYACLQLECRLNISIYTFFFFWTKVFLILLHTHTYIYVFYNF